MEKKKRLGLKSLLTSLFLLKDQPMVDMQVRMLKAKWVGVMMI